MTLSEILKSDIVRFMPEWMKEATYFISPLGLVAFEYIDSKGYPQFCYPRFNAAQIKGDFWVETPEDFAVSDFMARD